MDKIVSHIQTANTDSELKTLKSFLQKEEGILYKQLHVLDDVLTVLDPYQHSLGWSFILAAKAGSAKLDMGKFVNQVLKFIANANPSQIRIAPTKFSQVCRRFAEIAVESNQAMRAIKPLRAAVKKLKPSSETLTPVHADFLQVCLISRCYSIAGQLLNDEEILEINPDTSGVTPKDMLLYYYYGGMVYTGLKDFKKALIFFKQAVSAPAIVLSAIMVEAYKKYVLVSLLVRGKVPSLPRFTSSVVQRHHKTAFPQYQEFVNAYSTGSTDEVHKIAEQHMEIFKKDKNFGLVKQCIKSLYRRNIQKFTLTYLTFSLQEIATSVKLSNAKEAEKQILKMIENNEIFATVNQKDGMVSFQEDPEHYDNNKVMQNIDSQIQKAIDIGKRLRTLDESVASSATYLQRTATHERGGRWAGNEFDDLSEGPEKIGPPGGKIM